MSRPLPVYFGLRYEANGCCPGVCLFFITTLQATMRLQKEKKCATICVLPSAAQPVRSLCTEIGSLDSSSGLTTL